MGASETSRITVGWISFVILLLAMTMFVMPFMASSVMTDYGHPTVAKWENKDSKQQAIVQFDNEGSKKIVNFQKKLNLPFSLSVMQALFFGLTLAVLYLILMGIVFDIKDDNDDQVIAFMNAIGAFIIVVIATIVISVINYHGQNHEQIIRADIKDVALANEVVKAYVRDIIGNTTLPYLLIILLSIISSLAYTMLRFVWDGVISIIEEMLRCYKTKLLADMFKCTSTAEFASNDELIEILPNGTVELVNYHYDIVFKPFPVFYLRRHIIAQLSMDTFFYHLVSATKEEAFQELQTLLYEKYKNSFQKAGEKAIADFIVTVMGKVEEVFSKMLEEVKNEYLNTSREHAEMMLQETSKKTLRRFKNDLAKRGIEKIDEMLSDLKADIAREIKASVSPLSAIANQSMSQNQNEEIIPPNVRLRFSSGKYDVVLVEQSPMVRSILVDARLCGKRENTYFNVAFPYVVFLIVFEEGHLNSLWVYYRDKPLRSLDDMLYAPNLTNVNNDCGVCLGFNGHTRIGLIDRIDEVIDHFWGSRFNSDLNGHYEDYRRRDNRLDSFSTWQNESKKDPLFPLSIELIRKMTLRQSIDRITSWYGINGGINEDRIEEMIKEAFAASEEEMETAIRKRFSTMGIKNRYPDTVAKILEDHANNVAAASTETVAKSFAAVSRDGGLSEDLFNAFHSSVERTMEADFRELAKNVLFRRRVSAHGLIHRIKSNRRN